VENWRGKGRWQLVGIVIFVLGNIKRVLAGFVCKWVEIMEQQVWKKSTIYYYKLNGNNRKEKLAGELLRTRRWIPVYWIASFSSF